MKGPYGNVQQLPANLYKAVTAHARDLRRGVAGDDLFLLALLELPRDVTARRVLEAEGLRRDRVSAEIRTRGDEASDTRRGVIFPPAHNEMHGRAQAFAAALGDGRITPEYVLLALIWDPMSFTSRLLWRFGVRRGRLVDRLREAGVAVPGAPLPEQREIELGEPVWFDRMDAQRVLDRVRKRVPPGIVWGFNYDGDRARVDAESSVDLQSIVDEALAEPRPE